MQARMTRAAIYARMSTDKQSAVESADLERWAGARRSGGGEAIT